MNDPNTHARIHMYDQEIAALELQPGASYTLDQAPLLVEVARQSRSEALGGVAVAGHVRPVDFLKDKNLSIEERNKAAIATSVIERVSDQALRTQAYGMQLRTVED